MVNVKIYSKSSCPFCNMAKDLLKSKGYEYEEIVVDNDEKTLTDLINKTGHMTVPQIFFDDEFIGGFDELKRKFEKKSKL